MQWPLTVIKTDGSQTGHELPRARIQPIDGFGVVAVTDDQYGPTLLATADGFVEISEYPVLTASSKATLEARCSSAIACELVIVDVETGGESTVPQDFTDIGDTYLLSPDGGSLLRTTSDGAAALYRIADRSTTWIAGRGVQSPSWSPDSSFVVWLDLEFTAAANFMFPEAREWLTIELDEIAAPTPIGPELLVF